MPLHLELGSDGHSFKGKAIVVNTQTGKHYSSEPIPIEKAKAQKRILEAAEKKDDPPKSEKWIQKVVEGPHFKKGLFTREAAAEGLEPMAFMKEVLAKPEEYPLGTRRRAQFLHNIQRK